MNKIATLTFLMKPLLQAVIMVCALNHHAKCGVCRNYNNEKTFIFNIFYKFGDFHFLAFVLCLMTTGTCLIIKIYWLAGMADL